MDAIDVGDVLGFRPRLTKMEGLPCYGAPPKILFLVTAYDPDDHPDRSAAKAEERYQINETRASCLRLLKQALGPRFFGGFDRNPYTLERYPDLVVPRAVTAQGSYIETMRSYPICVATTGLHDSIGWKLAEYVAFGKAIVSEKLNYEVPGEFAPERNYLEFSSAEECVVAAERLLEDAGLRKAMMTSNTRYYEAYVRPDALVLNALLTALSRY
jgi:hypothetical protein